MTTPLPHGNCYRVAPQVIAGEYPGAKGRGDAQARIARHLDAGITCFLDLTEAGELAPYADVLAQAAAARGREVLHHRMPMRDVSVPTSPATMRVRGGSNRMAELPLLTPPAPAALRAELERLVLLDLLGPERQH